MFRALMFFLKAAAGAFFATCLLVGGVFWVLRSWRGSGSSDPATVQAGAAVTASGEQPAPVRESPSAPTASDATKRSGAAKIVSALQFAENVEASKRRAVQRYPELGVKDSAVNREFIRRMRLFQTMNPAFFEEALWPEKLADLMAVDLSLDSQNPESEGMPR